MPSPLWLGTFFQPTIFWRRLVFVFNFHCFVHKTQSVSPLCKSQLVKVSRAILYLWHDDLNKPMLPVVGEIKDGNLHIGQTTVPVYNLQNRTKVPDVLFYENHQVRTSCIPFLLKSGNQHLILCIIVLINLMRK